MKKFIVGLFLFTFITVPGLAFAFDLEVTSHLADPGDTVAVDINFSNNVDPVIAIDTIITYDPSVFEQLDFLSTTNGSAFAGAGCTLTPNPTVAGQLNVSQACLTEVTASSATIMTINFVVRTDAPGGASPITVTSMNAANDASSVPVNPIPQSGTVTVSGGNTAPTLNPIGSQTVQVNTTLSFTVSATDPDVGDTLTYSASPLPAGASFNTSTGAFSWTPTLVQTTNITFGVDDGNGGTDSEVVTFTVTSAPNNPPTLNPIGSQSVQAGNNLSFTISATDPDVGDTLTFGASPLPAGASFNTFTGAFSWTPATAQTVNVTFSVDDGNGGTDSEVVTITVTAAPTPHNAVVGSATVDVGDTFDIAITFSNNSINVVGVDTTLTWDPAILTANSVSNGSNFAGFQLTPNLTVAGEARVSQAGLAAVSDASGEVLVINFTAIGSGTTALTLSQLDFGDDVVGTVPVNNVTNGSVTANPVVVNTPPTLNPIGNQSVQAGNTLSFTVSATDPDVGDTLTFGATPLPAGASFNSSTGAFSWTPASAQTVNVTFSVDDGNGGTDSEIVTITVTGAATPHDAVVGSATVDQGDTFNIAITFTNNSIDVVGVDTTLTWDPAILTANSVSNGATFTGFQLTPNLTVPGEARVSQAGLAAVSAASGEVLVINFTATGSGTTALTLSQLDFGSDVVGTVPVNNITNGSVTANPVVGNTPPTLNPIGNQSVQVGNNLSFTVTATDPDVGDTLTFNAAPLPSGASFNTSTGAFSWTPASAQTVNVTFSVDDGNGGTDSELVTITVTAAPNNPPVLDPIGNQSVFIGNTLSFTVTGSDPDTDPITFSASPLPPGATFVGQTFTWTPQAGDEGTYPVTFTVSDGQLTDSETVSITATTAPDVPEITSPAPGTTISSSPVTFQWTTGTNVQQYVFTLGTASGAYDLYSFNTGGATSATVNVALDGTPVFAQIWSQIGGQWYPSTVVQYQRANVPVVTAQITSPVAGSTLTDGNVTVSWTPVAGALRYWLSIGTTSLGSDLVSFDPGLVSSTTVQLPLTGAQLYFNIYTRRSDGTWGSSNQVVVNAANLIPQIVSPTNGSSLFSVPTTIQWSPGSVVQRQVMAVGTTSGATDIFVGDVSIAGTQADIVIPLTGNPMFVRLWTKMAGFWFQSAEFTYNTPDLMPQFTSPAPGTTLTSTPINLVWDPGVGPNRHIINLGTTPGAYDIYSQDGVGGVTQIFTELTGSPVYAQIWSRVGTKWYGSPVVTYQTTNTPLPIAQFQSPANNTTITTSPQLISWTLGTGVSRIWLAIGSTPGGNDVANYDPGLVSSANVAIPLTGNPVYGTLWSRWGGSWYESTMFTWNTGTGAFVSSLTVPSIGSQGYDDSVAAAVTDGISANALTSVTQDDLVEQYNASAAAEMILSYLWWDQAANPEGPAELSDPNLSDQSKLFDYGKNANYSSSVNRLDAQGLWAVVQDLDPASYDWTVSTRADVSEALSDLANLLATEVTSAEGQPTVVPGAVAVGGSYDQWLVVTGVRASDDPNENESYDIDGFWVNNPDAEGLGSQAYVTAQHFANAYVLPLNGVSDEDPNLGQYATIVHASTYGGQGTIAARQARWDTPPASYLEVATVDVNGATATVYNRTYDAAQTAAIIATAEEGVADEVAQYDTEVAAVVANTSAASPLLVQSATGGYYLVPFAAADGSGTVAVAVVDAATGTFGEVAWSNEAVAYPAVSLDSAILAVAAETGASDLSGAEAELSHTGGNLYQPVWKVYFAGEEFRVDQKGKVTTATAVVE